MAVWIFWNKHVIGLFRKWRYKLIALLELGPWCVTGKPYGAIATIFVIVPVYVRVYVCLFPCPFLSLFPCPFLLTSLCQLNTALRIFLSDMAIIQFNFQDPYEVARKLKGPLTWEGIDKINWKSRRLFLKERPIGWYHFQPNKSRWTVPLNFFWNVCFTRLRWLNAGWLDKGRYYNS